MKQSEQLHQVTQDIKAVEEEIKSATFNLHKTLDGLRATESELKKEIETEVKDSSVKTYDDDFIKVTVMEPYERKSVDTKKMQEENPELVEKYRKVSTVKGRVTIKVKE